MSALSTDRLRAIAIACLMEPGTPGVAELIAERGHEEVLRLCIADTGKVRVPGRIDPHEVPAMLAEMSRLGVRVVLPGEAEFPSQLLDLTEPPLALWVRGPLDLRASALRSVAVVGARACTAYGERATASLAGGLADAGWTVASGAAFGIDAAAHRAALGASGPTVAVLAGGVDVAYPRAHDALLGRIADAGVVISELPPGSQPLKHRFLARNRLIAALTRGTVVVEAARRSGAVSTAARALEIGRVVMAVPGPITSMASAGTNRLLFEQSARAVSDSAEVVALLVGPEAAGSTAWSMRGQRTALGASSSADGVRASDRALPSQGTPDEVPGGEGSLGPDGKPDSVRGSRGSLVPWTPDVVRGGEGLLDTDGTPEDGVGGSDRSLGLGATRDGVLGTGRSAGPEGSPDVVRGGEGLLGPDGTLDGARGSGSSLVRAGTPDGDAGPRYPPPQQLAGLPEEASWVLAALPSRGARTVEVVAERASVSAAACLALLGILELAGLARRTASGWHRNG